MIPPPGVTHDIKRYEFLDSPASITQHELAAGLHLKKIDQALFSRFLWNAEMTLEYVTSENFLKWGLGLCLMRGDEICCESYAVFHANRRYVLGVITPKAFRGLGYGYTTCSHLTGICASMGFQTSWSCHQTNEASTALARKLGYRTQRECQMLNYASTA